MVKWESAGAEKWEMSLVYSGWILIACLFQNHSWQSLRVPHHPSSWDCSPEEQHKCLQNNEWETLIRLFLPCSLWWFLSLINIDWLTIQLIYHHVKLSACLFLHYVKNVLTAIEESVTHFINRSIFGRGTKAHRLLGKKEKHL